MGFCILDCCFFSLIQHLLRLSVYGCVSVYWFILNCYSFAPTKLSRKVINMGELRRLASQGIPDGAGIRSTVWKVRSYLCFQCI